MLRDKVKKTIEERALADRGDAVILGLSGGPDSLCLFDILAELREELGFSLTAVHVNHRLRPGAAEEDQAFVESICRERGVPCESYVYDCAAYAKEKGLTSEEAGRELRYRAFFEVAEKLLKGEEAAPEREEAASEMKATAPESERPAPESAPVKALKDRSRIKIALAHNLNDQAETLLFRLMRGSGTDGLAGMEYKRTDESGFAVIRPILGVKRSEIEEYCEARRLSPRRDHTNEEALYTRNSVRLGLIPYIEREYNPNIAETLFRLSQNAAEDREYIWKRAAESFERLRLKEAGSEKKEARIALDLAGFRLLDRAEAHRLVLMAFDEIGLSKDVSRAHIEVAEKLISGGRSTGGCDFPKGYRLSLSYDKLVFSGPEAESDKAFDITAERPEAPEGCVWRTRLPGDYIKVKLSRAGEEPERWGRKKLQDYFTDKKIPREERDRIPLLCRGSEVLRVELPESERKKER